MMKHWKHGVTLLLAGLLAVLSLTGCGDSDASLRQAIGRALSLDCSAGEITQRYDSHGGFHGDGTSFYAVTFPDDAVAQVLVQSDDWKPLPPSDQVTAVLWGLETDELNVAPLIVKDNDYETDSLMPRVTEGYYFFRDRHSAAADPKDDTHIFDEDRYSYNVTVAVYDSAAHTLYFAEVDT